METIKLMTTVYHVDFERKEVTEIVEYDNYRNTFEVIHSVLPYERDITQEYYDSDYTGL